MSLHGFTIKEIEEKLHNKDLSAEELVDMSLKQIKAVDEDINAFITLDEENARNQAKELDNQNQKDKKLFAVPNGIKDNIVTKGLRTTCASQILKNFDDPLYDATVVSKLQDEQSITIGKLNMDEFAMGSSTETSSFGLTRNPWHKDHVPGGSSGGSAAAVAAGEVVFSLGSDTGGSIRQPAAFCGIVGIKPTYGLVSRYGLVAMASSLDQIGPMTKTVEDNARVLEVIAGRDAHDATSSNKPVPSYTEGLTGDIKGLKIALPEQFLNDLVDPEVKDAVMSAVQMLESLGAIVETVSLTHLTYGPSAYYVLSTAEASTSLARFDGVRFGVRSENSENMIDMMKNSRGEGIGHEAKRRIIMGTHILSNEQYEDYFVKAQKVRTLMKQDFEAIFNTYDLVIGPTTATPAFKLNNDDYDKEAAVMTDLLSVPANLTGLPAISLPCGFTKEKNLPVGLQIIGKAFDELTVYRAAHAYEQATDHHQKHPVLEGGTK